MCLIPILPAALTPEATAAGSNGPRHSLTVGPAAGHSVVWGVQGATPVHGTAHLSYLRSARRRHEVGVVPSSGLKNNTEGD